MNVLQAQITIFGLVILRSEFLMKTEAIASVPLAKKHRSNQIFQYLQILKMTVPALN